ncbi:hypothetical protein FRZ67_22120 [Panacibacter ginsenosidivorans]|uniref:Uncharacterized protein n=1 Tax=Panacibacter ginsenosidivorans TaxID=1813871 RepID=A0A5B8VFU1_9BACT|nr:hypothetical protein [Panacibacter ginsenosidivorans]QEC69862.1 hypothetical protein FRZ67_22120 [Panacibacter ginsenosidivorans]
MKEENKTSSRKKFMLGAIAIFTSLTALKFWLPKDNKKGTEKKDTVKMLTQDGRLVEIDKALLTSKNKKITDEELKTWVKK